MNQTRSCEHCGANVSADAKFCRECGKTISGERACPHCGAALSPTAQFCRECGKPITPVPSQPPATRVAALPGRLPRTAKQPVTPRRSGSKGGVLIVGGCVALVMLCLIGAAGVFFAIRSGTITQTTLLNLVGLGPATIEVMNFRDDAIQAGITPLRESKEGTTEEESQSTFALDAFEFSSYGASDPGKYRVEIRPTSKSTPAGLCTLTVRGGDLYRFIALPNGIMVNRANSPSLTGKDLVLETSAFCR